MKILDQVAEQVGDVGKVEVVAQARRPQHDHGARARQAGPGRAKQRAAPPRRPTAADADGTAPTDRHRGASAVDGTEPPASDAERRGRRRRHRLSGSAASASEPGDTEESTRCPR